MKNILYIVPSEYDALAKKGVLNIITERDEGGFFDKVVTLHPFARYNRTIEVAENNRLIEYGWQFLGGIRKPQRLIKVFGVFVILLKLLFVFPWRIKREKISLIRATDPYLMGLIGLYYGKLFRLPLVVSIHSDYDKRYILDGAKGSFTLLGSRRLAKRLEYFVYRHADRVLPIREYMKRDIENLGIVPGEKIQVFPHGISFHVFDETPVVDIHRYFGIPEEKKIVSFVGRLSHENYIDEIISVAQRVIASRDDVLFLLVGGGNEYDRLTATVRHEGIFFTGFQEKEIVVNVRRQSVLSLCLMGGFSLIEACAAGRPVIAYDVEWHGELVREEETGYLPREHDWGTVAQRVDCLLDQPELCDMMGRRARELAYERHELRNTTKVKQDIYKRLLYG